MLLRIEEAHRLIRQQRYSDAAHAFEELARSAQIRDPRRAPQFYLQAARACWLNQEIDRAMQYVHHGLGLLAVDGQWLRLEKIGTQIVAELEEKGLTTQSASLQTWLHQTLPAPEPVPAADLIPPPIIRRPRLPVLCPSCGGPLRPNEIEWLDDITAECDYCGTPIRSEEKE